MSLKMNERQAVTKVFAERYKAANKKQKKVILNEFIDLAGYGRCYASYLLRINGKHVTSSKALPANNRKVAKRIRVKEYDSAVLPVLKKIWAIMDCICGKRLEPILKEVIPILGILFIFHGNYTLRQERKGRLRFLALQGVRHDFAAAGGEPPLAQLSHPPLP
ncbi:MAG: hypothetical protein HQL61_03200 [Magnetococcales bacterium]|nr:hypothetical protein [Nitrospirota bacterium]